jgi:2-isopropylmalate synthase
MREVAGIVPAEITRADDANRVHIFDTTLRDGEQAAGIALNPDEKLEIAQQLVRLNVDVIEAGFPINSPEEFVAVQGIARAVEGPVICALARTHKVDIDRAWEAIKEAERPRIHTFISTSDIHITHQLRTTRKDVLGQARAGVARAKELCDDVEFSPMDATRADIEYTAEVCAVAIEEGATVINIPDTVGYAVPQEMYDYVKQLQVLVPAIGEKGVMLSVHCHDDLDMATANAVAGLQAGARQVEVSINGIGERAGNGQLAALVMLLNVRRDCYGLYTDVVTQELGPTSKLVAAFTGYDIPHCMAIMGLNSFKHEAGIHADGQLKNRANYEIMDPRTVGMEPKSLVLGKHSGKHMVNHALAEEITGYDPKFFEATFAIFQDFAGKLNGISSEQLGHIHQEAKRRERAEFRVLGFDVQSTQEASVATVSITGSAAKEVTSSASSDGEKNNLDGPVDALFTALNEATATSFELADYDVKAIGEGKKTIGLAEVILRINGETVTGHGLSTNTLEASAWAYVDALTRALSVAHGKQQG